jgi:hypothetical protein
LEGKEMTIMTVADASPRRFEPMKTAGTQHFIERTYRESGTFQWVRETFKNAEEAGATRVEFGIEWQAVENKGVFRRTIADNGKGMSAEQLVAFFNTFGGGGKPIGGAHENFGVGSKTSLLPWNKAGMVVVSWIEGDASMIWVEQDQQSGEYGLRVELVEDEDGNEAWEPVYAPYDDTDEVGCNWSQVKPDWIDKNGTVIILLGNTYEDDTVLGDPNRNEADIKGISTYLNRRFWEIPNEVSVAVDELRSNDRKRWPIDREMALQSSSGGSDRRINHRAINGAKYFITYPRSNFTTGKLGASGEVSLSDGTVVEWYLWEGERPAVQSYAAISGYIAARYRNELFDVSQHPSSFRSFGVSESSVRARLWLIIRPLEFGEAGRGVYPRTDRNALLLQGGPNPGGALPIQDWASEFTMQMPEAIRAAISEARGNDTGSLTDDAYRERLAERFGSRWRIPKLRALATGSFMVSSDQRSGTSAKARVKAKRRVYSPPGGAGGSRSGQLTLGNMPGPEKAAKRTVAGGIPHYRPVNGSEMSAGILATWQPNDPEFPEGVVLINKDHPVLIETIMHFQGQFADHVAEEVARDVIEAYGQIAVAKVAHSEHLRSLLASSSIEDMRSDTALTMSLIGLVAEESYIAPKLGGKFGRKRQAA